MGSASTISPGIMRPTDTWGEYTNILFVIRQALSKMQTATLVKIVSCTNSGGLSPVGFVNVIPLINQLTGPLPPNGDSQGVPHVTILDVPYLRIQGGSNAIILDPQEGDIGTLLRCWAGCSVESIMAALHLPVSALFDDAGLTPQQRREAAQRSQERDAEAKAQHHAGCERGRELYRLENLAVLSRGLITVGCRR